MADVADGCCVHSLSSQQTPVWVAASAGSQFWEPSFTFRGKKPWMEVHDIVQETGIKEVVDHFPKKRNAKKQNGCLKRP